MKFTIVFLFLAGMFYGQDCECVENFKNNHWLKYPRIFITNTEIKSANDNFEIHGNCVGIMRMYLNDGKRDYEKEKIMCTSQYQFNFRISPETVLHFFDSKTGNLLKFCTTESKVSFLKNLQKNKRKAVFELELNEERSQIRQISQRGFLEN